MKKRIEKLSQKNDGKEWKRWKKLKNSFDESYGELKRLEKKEEKIKNKPLFDRVSRDGVYDDDECLSFLFWLEEVRKSEIKNCPKCNSELIVDENGYLCLLGDHDSENTSQKIKELNKIKKYYDELNEVRKAVKELNQRLKEYEEEPEPPSEEEIDTEKLEREIKELSKYEEMEEYDFAGMHRYLDWSECMMKLESHESEDYWEYRYDSAPDDEWAQKYFTAKETYDRCKKFLEEYQIMDTGTYQKKKSKLENLEEEIKSLERARKVLKWKENEQKIRDRRVEMGKCDERFEKAASLSQKIEGLLNKNLELFLVDFNNLVNDAISYVFEDMSIYISLYKKNKVNKKTKPCVNIEIIYKGKKYESFSSFSGGERNRISLAFTLVFAKICKARFVFLDEFMAFLNSERRIQCLDLIKAYCEDKIVVNVCHETVEGYYDNVIEITSLA